MEENLAEIIGKNIMRLRKMSGMTQLELAEKLNYSDKSISKWEQGNGIPDVRILMQIAEVFNVTLDELVHERAERPVMPKKTRLLRRCVILGCSVGLCWLAAVISFVLGGVIAPETQLLWLSFVYAVPVSSIVVLVFSCIWSWKWVRLVSISVLIWTALLSVYLTIYGILQLETAALIFLIGVPLQVMALILFLWWKKLPFFRNREDV